VLCGCSPHLSFLLLTTYSRSSRHLPARGGDRSSREREAGENLGETRVIPKEDGSGEMQGANHMLLKEPLCLAFGPGSSAVLYSTPWLTCEHGLHINHGVEDLHPSPPSSPLASVLTPARPLTSPPPFLSCESHRRSAPCVVWFDQAWVSECGVTGNGVGSDQAARGQGFATGPMKSRAGRLHLIC
jgi:hypothetical protein